MPDTSSSVTEDWLTWRIEGAVLDLSGAWTTTNLSAIHQQLQLLTLPAGQAVEMHGAELRALDTGGAWLLSTLQQRLRAQGGSVRLVGLKQEFLSLMQYVEEKQNDDPMPAAGPAPGLLHRLGEVSVEHTRQAFSLLAFLGEIFVTFLRSIWQPKSIRWSAIIHSIEYAGVYALPITGLLTFLMGVVIAYQGGIQLRSYGANIFIVELVSITMLRELGPIMAAIIVAGRTGSAYTAEIATMKVTEEIDALRTIGIPPMNLLVLPKVMGLMIALPLLTVFADIAGVMGGMVMASTMLDVTFVEFANRIPETVSISSFYIGVGKSFVFAGIIAMVGCYQGMQVEGGADSVGQQTTVSVVQSIFLVIVADAAFSILFSMLGI